MNWPTPAQVAERREQFPVGARVRLLRWAPSEVPGLEHGEPSVPVGTLGTVRHVDDSGTVFCDWDTGSGLGACTEDSIVREEE